MGGQLVLQACDVVGESAVWDDRRGRLVWVDIIGRRVQAFDPVTGEHTLWPLQGRPKKPPAWLREDRSWRLRFSPSY